MPNYHRFRVDSKRDFAIPDGYAAYVQRNSHAIHAELTKRYDVRSDADFAYFLRTRVIFAADSDGNPVFPDGNAARDEPVPERQPDLPDSHRVELCFRDSSGIELTLGVDVAGDSFPERFDAAKLLFGVAIGEDARADG